MTVIDDARGFDFHCHVDLDPDPSALIRRCEEERIVTLAVTTTPKAWPQNRIWTAHSRYVIPALGLHPELVVDRHAEITLLESYMAEARFIGEIGLDGSPKHRRGFKQQQAIFSRMLESAERLGGRVLTIHSRRAAADVIAIIKRLTTADRVLCILHWFSDTPATARKAAEAGCYFSVNGQMLANERGRSLVKNLPLDRLLTETDSPFTAAGSRPSLPWDVRVTTRELAKLHAVQPDEMGRLVSDNAGRVLAFAGVSNAM
jgi:TatD DNase family protein